MDKLKQTGRTTRLLAEAQMLEKQGRAVYVMVANQTHAKLLQHALPADTTIKLETPDSLTAFDWHVMRLRTAHPNCVVLVDHFAIESQFSRMLEMLHRYDA